MFAVFQKWLVRAEKETCKSLMCLHTDNGGEYLSKDFDDFCDAKGIKRELTAPYNPPQNGVAERMNHTLQERVLCMLTHASLPMGF